MSLFDLTALTIEQVRVNQARNDGPTIRHISKTGKLSTVRHKPWWMLLGKGPDAATCGGCIHLRRHNGKYFKCGKHVVTAGTGTDIRCKDAACRLYEPNDKRA